MFSIGDVTKILVIIRCWPYWGLMQFPNAKVSISKTGADQSNLGCDNIVYVEFDDSPCFKFEKSQNMWMSI